jgi:hypothetical protein
MNFLSARFPTWTSVTSSLVRICQKENIALEIAVKVPIRRLLHQIEVFIVTTNLFEHHEN